VDEAINKKEEWQDEMMDKVGRYTARVSDIHLNYRDKDRVMRFVDVCVREQWYWIMINNEACPAAACSVFAVCAAAEQQEGEDP
jgi:hypothetical protein